MWIRKRGELYTGTAWADCTSILCRNARKESDWMAKSFFLKLQRRLRYRKGGVTAVRDTLKKLYDRKDY